jgi:hypothetical protein
MKTSFALFFLMLSMAMASQNKNNNLATLSVASAKKTSYRISLGTTVSLPYRSTEEIWPDFANHPIAYYHSQYGYFAEALVDYRFTPKLTLSSGLNWNTTNLDIDEKSGIATSNYIRSTTYLTLPMYVNYRFSKKIPLMLSAGPYVGYLIKAKEEGTTFLDTDTLLLHDPDPLLEDSNYGFSDDVTSNFNTIDIGLSIGLDFDFKISQTLGGLITTRYVTGFTNTINSDVRMEWKNRSIQIGLGIVF